jgi:hypothetical protein
MVRARFRGVLGPAVISLASEGHDGFGAELTPTPLPAAKTRELIRDPRFERGFAVLAPEAGGGELGRIACRESPAPPVWQLAQWHSRFPFTNALATEGGELCVSNVAKWFCLDRRPAESPVLTLAVDSRPEYAGGARCRRAEAAA